MSFPGVNVAFGDATPSAGAPIDTAQAFVLGVTEKGLLGKAYRVTSLSSFDSQLGGRVATSVLRDWVETALREGVSVVYISRILGVAPATAKVTLKGAAAADSLQVSAASPGDHGNALKVAVIAGATSGFRLRVSNATDILETSPDFTTTAAAEGWKATYVVVKALGTPVPVVAAAASLVGGDDDLDGISAATKTAALGAFSRDLGPGQVIYPGEQDEAVLSVARAHCEATDRVLIKDVVDSATLANLVAPATAARADDLASYGATFGPYVSIPGPVSGTVRRVPYSAVQAGICARADRLFGPGRAGAGDEFPHLYAVDFVDFTDAEHETATLAGLNLAKRVYGTPQTYGFRSSVDPSTDPEWVQFNYARLRMAVSSRLNAAAQGFVFETIDPARHKVQEFKDALTGVLAGFGDAVWGFRIDVGETVNTLDTIRAGELHAVIAVQFSPYAEVVYINVAKVPLNQSL